MVGLPGFPDRAETGRCERIAVKLLVDTKEEQQTVVTEAETGARFLKGIAQPPAQDIIRIAVGNFVQIAA